MVKGFDSNYTATVATTLLYFGGCIRLKKPIDGHRLRHETIRVCLSRILINNCVSDTRTSDQTNKLDIFRGHVAARTIPNAALLGACVAI